MQTTYGTILRSTAQTITRAVYVDAQTVRIETFVKVQEVEVDATMLEALERMLEAVCSQDPVPHSLSLPEEECEGHDEVSALTAESSMAEAALADFPARQVDVPGLWDHEA